MTTVDILAALPHRPPMLLVDEVLALHADRVVCRKTFREEEFFFQGHFPGQPVVPGVILCESAMQAGGVLLSTIAELGEDVPVLTRLDHAKFKRIVRPGETIQMEVRLKRALADVYFMIAEVVCDGQIVTRFEFACARARIPK